MNTVVKNTELTIEAIFDKYYDLVVNRANSMIHNIDDAQDIAAKVFVKVNRLLPTYDANKAQLSTWIFKITNSAIIDFTRNKSYQKYENVSQFTDEDDKENFQFSASHAANADENILADEKRKVIINAFKTLKPKQRRISNLFFIHGYQIDEIAERLNIPVGTVKVTIMRCREKLQSQLSSIY